MFARKGEAWNDEDTATLKRMYLAGRDNLSIARALERTQSSVVARISLLRRRRALSTPAGKKNVTKRSYGE